MKPVEATHGLLFISFLYREDLHSGEELIQFYEKKFGNCFSFVPSLNPLSKYYSQEMGKELKRIFCLSSEVFSRETLLNAKLESLSWEESWTVGERRMVNVDVGFLSLENFILATTKNFSHRVFIGKNIYADLTYYFHQGDLQYFPWTYPDYQDEEKRKFFLWGRAYLLQSMSVD